MNKEALCENLLQWLNTFSIPCPHSTIEEVSDGVALATVLSQIAPDWFDDKWLAKIKQNAGNNWRMKVSNLKKILQGILDYYNEVLGQNIQNFSMPDVHKIGEAGDATELARFLQLILGCAVNCDKKQNYIEAIMGMEEVVQQAIMAAIQELMTKESFISTVDSLSSFDPQIRRLTDEMEMLKQMKETYMQKCHELDLQVSLLNEEKAAVSTENEKLLQRIKEFETSVESPNKINYLRQQVETLREEIDKLENAKEESKLKFEKLEKDNLELVARLEVLQNAAEAARQQQDELDILKESQAKFQAQESSIAQYKKKLEDLGNMKRQFKTLEEKNSEYMQRNLELEEELMRTGSWKPQLEIYKKQVSELRQKIVEETKRADKSEFEMNKMAEKLSAIQREKERLLTERDNLKENYEELRCSTLQTTPVTNSNHLASETLGIIPIDMTEQIEKMKMELKDVREKKSSEIGLLQAQIDHLQEREAELTSDNRCLSCLCCPNMLAFTHHPELNNCSSPKCRVMSSKYETNNLEMNPVCSNLPVCTCLFTLSSEFNSMDLHACENISDAKMSISGGEIPFPLIIYPGKLTDQDVKLSALPNLHFCISKSRCSCKGVIKKTCNLSSPMLGETFCVDSYEHFSRKVNCDSLKTDKIYCDEITNTRSQFSVGGLQTTTIPHLNTDSSLEVQILDVSKTKNANSSCFLIVANIFCGLCVP